MSEIAVIYNLCIAPTHHAIKNVNEFMSINAAFLVLFVIPTKRNP